MLIAADYPFMDILWTMVIFFAWVIYIWTVVAVLGDLFRRHDIAGWGKAAWTLLIIALPFVGVLSYLVVHGQRMAERSASDARKRQQEFNAYVREAAGSGGAAAEIERAKGLLDAGAIDQTEFEAIKQRALA